MQFTITYRNTSGAMVTEAVDAADRAECLAQLKKRGIAPTSVKEGGAKQDKKAVGGKAKPTGRNGVAYVLLAACIILAVLGGIWLFGRGKEPPPQDGEMIRKPSALAKEVTPAKAAPPVSKPAATLMEQGTAKTPQAHSAGQPDVAVAASSDTNATMAANKKFRVVRHANAKKKMLFKERSDQRISRLLSVEPGGFLVGSFTYKGIKDQFLKSLKTPIEITDEDSEKDVAIKRAVLETRADLKARLDAGEDIEQIMEDTERELRRLSNYRTELVKQLNLGRREGNFTAEEMKSYVDTANQLLKENGIKPLSHPEMFYRNMKISETSDVAEEKTDLK